MYFVCVCYECIFVWENKSLTNVGEFVKLWTTVEEYVCLPTLLRMFLMGMTNEDGCENKPVGERNSVGE